MKALLLLLLTAVVPVYSLSAINFPGRLSAKEASELRKTCGRRPVESVVHPERKSFASRFTDRREAPWVSATSTASATLISKRHILTCAHGKPEDLHPKLDGLFVNTCKRGNNIMKCTEKPIQSIKVAGISYLKGYTEYDFMGIYADIAILTLEKDIESSELIYPACLGGYPVDKNVSLVQYGYGYSSPEENKRGIDKGGFLQTFTGIRFANKKRDLALIYGVEPTPKSHALGGDSGSAYIHKRNGTASVYAVHRGGTNDSKYGRVGMATRLSPYLYWITAVTGIDVKDEDMEFTGYFYPLMFKDNRNTKTFLAGAQHPSKVY